MKNLLKKFLYLFLLFFILFPSSVIAQDKLPENPLLGLEWEYLGGPAGGIGYDIRIDSKSPNIIYVTDANAGVFKSMNFGKSLFPINAGIETVVGFTGDSIPVFSVTIDPNDSDTLWLGTQNITGIYKSKNAGGTWENKTNGIEERFITFRGFTVDPNDSNIVYAAGEIPSHEWAREEIFEFNFDKTKGAIYRTINGGDNWNKIWEGDNLARYVWIDPTNSNRIWASTGIFDRTAANANIDNNNIGGVGIIYSEDFGETWKLINEENGLSGLYVGSLFLHPKNPDVLIAGTGFDDYTRQPHGVYITENGGSDWKKVKEIQKSITSVEFCEIDPDIIYAAGEYYFYKSEDGGKSWEQKGDYLWGTSGRKAGIPIDLACDYLDTNKVFVNSYNGGNIVSIDGGETWNNASIGYSGSEIHSVKLDSNNPAKVFVTSLEGFAISEDSGQT